MDEYYSLIQKLPPPFCTELAGLNPQIAPHVQELRLRADQPALFTVKGRLSPCVKYLPRASHCQRLTRQAVQDCFLSLCRHSAYAYEDELRQGYFTIPGGSRVGVAGVRGPAGFACVTSLNLRVARWITCELPVPVVQALADLSGGILVAGVPGSGKTTFLRSMIRYLGQGDHVFCVVDERGELLWGGSAGLPREHAAPCDVYTQHPKAEAICMALRCMNPQAIVCDELGTEADAAALEAGLASGVVFLASVHCDSIEHLESRPQLARLLHTGAFATAVLLEGRSHPGVAARVVAL